MFVKKFFFFTVALEIAKAHNQDLQVVGSCPSECVCATTLHVIYISFHIHSLGSLNPINAKLNRIQSTTKP